MASRIPLKRPEPSDRFVQIFRGRTLKQTINFVEQLRAGEIYQIDAFVGVSGISFSKVCAASRGWCRCETVAKRVHSRSHFAFLGTGAGALESITPVGCDLLFGSH